MEESAIGSGHMNGADHTNDSAHTPSGSGPVLITGGCGFVGVNLAHRLASEGRRVRVFDDLSRQGVEDNLHWLCCTHPDLIEVEQADIRDEDAVRGAARDASAIFHFAAQVAVTTSLTEPLRDFEINARGTLNLLEAVRHSPSPPPFIFTSTNKVYGDLEDIALRLREGRYEPEEEEVRAHGIPESRPLDFHSPYGCSKGAADQYVIDYARTFGLPALVFRMSCIYGPHQKGNEDQGWVAHFLIRALENEAITLYGDGRQVRDLLYVEDLVDAFLLAESRAKELSAQAFNIGGGASNTFSLLEVIDYIAQLQGERPEVHFGQWRLGDQRYYVSDARRFQSATGWAPRVGVRQGVRLLMEWLQSERGLATSSPVLEAVTA
jgi:CDP-paratose 2-epimerase